MWNQNNNGFPPYQNGINHQNLNPQYLNQNGQFIQQVAIPPSAPQIVQAPNQFTNSFQPVFQPQQQQQRFIQNPSVQPIFIQNPIQQQQPVFIQQPQMIIHRGFVPVMNVPQTQVS